MAISPDTLLTVLALVFFGIATARADSKFNGVAAGLFCLTLTLLV